MKRLLAGLVVFALTVAGSHFVIAQQPPPAASGAQGGAAPQPIGFFITSVGLGKGANLGGLAGADAHCQALAAAAGAGNRTWRAYLSQTASGTTPAVNARDRIGNGPWHNQRGQLIAQNTADLHGDVQRDRNQINKDFALTEKGTVVRGRGDTGLSGESLNQHDILTGSDSTGHALTGDSNTTTCGNWTSEAAAPAGAAVGHHDRNGGNNTSWNAAHFSRGCSQANLVATGGAGLLYCFAAQ